MSYQTKDDKGNIIEIGGLYKLKEGRTLNQTEEYLSKSVRFCDYVINPLLGDEDKYYINFDYVFENTLEPTSLILSSSILPYDVFFEYFELYKTCKEVNAIIFKNMREEKINE